MPGVVHLPLRERSLDRVAEARDELHVRVVAMHPLESPRPEEVRRGVVARDLLAGRVTRGAVVGVVGVVPVEEVFVEEVPLLALAARHVTVAQQVEGDGAGRGLLHPDECEGDGQCLRELRELRIRSGGVRALWLDTHVSEHLPAFVDGSGRGMTQRTVRPPVSHSDICWDAPRRLLVRLRHRGWDSPAAFGRVQNAAPARPAIRHGTFPSGRALGVVVGEQAAGGEAGTDLGDAGGVEQVVHVHLPGVAGGVAAQQVAQAVGAVRRGAGALDRRDQLGVDVAADRPEAADLAEQAAVDQHGPACDERGVQLGLVASPDGDVLRHEVVVLGGGADHLGARVGAGEEQVGDEVGPVPVVVVHLQDQVAVGHGDRVGQHVAEHGRLLVRADHEAVGTRFLRALQDPA